MSAILIQFAEEKARRLSLRSKTQVGTISRLLGRADCGEVLEYLAKRTEWDKRRHA